MLRTRIVTAVLLLAVLLPALFLLPRAGWVLFTLAVALVALWEWTRIAPLPGNAGRAFLAASTLLGVALSSFLVQSPIGEPGTPSAWIARTGFALATLFWLAAAPWWLRSRWRPRQPLLLAGTGWIVIFPTWFALIAHRENGPWFLLALMAVIWIADICAYFAGRRFGRHKLAPEISPGKTWEGVYGAIAGVVVYAAACSAIVLRIEGAATISGARVLAVLVLAFVVLAGLSIVGDLFESWLKRGSDHKDSSNLLPGHGGVLDRIDALTPTVPVAPILALPLADVMQALARAGR